MADYKAVEAVIDEQLKRNDLTPEDVLRLTLARRLNSCSDSILAQALGGADIKPPLNIWNNR